VTTVTHTDSDEGSPSRAAARLIIEKVNDGEVAACIYLLGEFATHVESDDFDPVMSDLDFPIGSSGVVGEAEHVAQAIEHLVSWYQDVHVEGATTLAGQVVFEAETQAAIDAA
jgi:hypothetical protein